VWCDTIGRARKIEPAFVTVFDAGARPALLLPLAVERRNGIGILRFMDCRTSDCNAPVLLPAARHWGAKEGLAIWPLLRKKLPPFDVAVFEKMPPMVEELPNPMHSLATAASRESYHVMRLHGPWETTERKLLPNAKDSRQRRRRLDRAGKVAFEIARTEAEREHFIDAMIAMKRRQYLETRGWDMFREPGLEQFYRETSRRLGANGPVQLSALLLDGKILAVHWGYVAGDRFYSLMPAHAGAHWLNYAVGRLLLEFQIEWSVRQGLDYFDFALGDEPYKARYCDITIPLHDAIIPVSLKGLVYAGVMKSVEAAKNRLRNSRLEAPLRLMRSRWRSRSRGD
jgi:CelD/BcsL family acetyltransferase involved in cellulose biosynthesis